MSRTLSRVVGLATALPMLVSLPAGAVTAPAANPSVPPPSVAGDSIFDPQRAPIIILRIGVHRIILVPRSGGNSTTIGADAIAQKPNNTTFSSVIASSVPGAAAAPSGELHIRGSHGQYSYYLDGAPLPANVSGSFSELINPKDIETLRVYTGGFPAEYGGQLAAIFDVTAKAGLGKKPSGFVQQLVQTYSAYETTAQVGGSVRPLSYFVSGIRSSSNIRLSPLTQTPLHDAGLENLGFGKFDLQNSAHDRLTLDVGASGATIQVPNDYLRQAVGQNDLQKEDGKFANLILRHLSGLNTLRVAFYSHDSRLRFFGSPQDLGTVNQQVPDCAYTKERSLKSLCWRHGKL